MRKALTAAMAAITLGGAVLATAAPAQAEHYRGGYYGGGDYGGGDYRRHSNNDGAAIAAGVIGLALGAALASSHNSYSGRAYSDRSYDDQSYNDRGYYGRQAYAYGNGYDYDYPSYQTCVTTRWVWDPYIGRRVAVQSRYAC